MTPVATPTPTRRRTRLGPLPWMIGALTLMTFTQAAAGDWIMVLVLACTIGFMIFREKEYRR